MKTSQRHFPIPESADKNVINGFFQPRFLKAIIFFILGIPQHPAAGGGVGGQSKPQALIQR